MALQRPKSVLFEALRSHDRDSIAIMDTACGQHSTYATLLQDVQGFKQRLLEEIGRTDISGARVAFIVENGYNYAG